MSPLENPSHKNFALNTQSDLNNLQPLPVISADSTDILTDHSFNESKHYDYLFQLAILVLTTSTQKKD